MYFKEIDSIEEVIAALENIIADCKERHDTMGYFAALYHKVTVSVRDGIEEGFFDDNALMEKLDVVFAKRYLVAYENFKNASPTTLSWQKAFQLKDEYWPIVLQHLLMGINAHINLDLGIAAAEVCQGKNIHKLKADFDRINMILSSLVKEVQQHLSIIWRPLKTILSWTGNADDLIVDFSMEIARDGAWEFALNLAETPTNEWPKAIVNRDIRIDEIARLITKPSWFIRLGLKVVRLGETGSISHKIKILESQNKP